MIKHGIDEAGRVEHGKQGDGQQNECDGTVRYEYHRVEQIMSRIFEHENAQEFTSHLERGHSLMDSQCGQCSIGQQRLLIQTVRRNGSDGNYVEKSEENNGKADGIQKRFSRLRFQVTVNAEKIV